jgi:sulfide dehydrogenase cytochrome subunit
MVRLASRVLAVLGVLLLPGVVTAGSNISHGMALAYACAACHGPDGHSQGAIPSIDKLPPEAFVAALKAFRADSRKGTVMNRIAKGLDDTEIDAIAAYFATSRQH